MAAGQAVATVAVTMVVATMEAVWRVEEHSALEAEGVRAVAMVPGSHCCEWQRLQRIGPLHMAAGRTSARCSSRVHSQDISYARIGNHTSLHNRLLCGYALVWLSTQNSSRSRHQSCTPLPSNPRVGDDEGGRDDGHDDDGHDATQARAPSVPPPRTVIESLLRVGRIGGSSASLPRCQRATLVIKRWVAVYAAASWLRHHVLTRSDRQTGDWPAPARQFAAPQRATTCHARAPSRILYAATKPPLPAALVKCCSDSDSNTKITCAAGSGRPRCGGSTVSAGQVPLWGHARHRTCL